MSTVVLSGSLGSTSAMWDQQLRVLSAHRVVLIEHPGHGAAPVVELDGVGGLAQRVLAQVDAERFFFVGLSLGGAVGMRLALDVPERLEKLVLCCTSAHFGPPEQWRERAELVRAEGVGAVVEAVLERWFTPEYPDVQRFRDMLLSTDREGYARCCEALAQWDVRDELADVTTPTLCIAGDDDPSTPPEHLRQIAGAIPGARCSVVARARHLASVQRSGEVNRLLAEFLA